MPMVIDKVCGQCGSTNIWVDAAAVWCVTKQTWVLESLFDHTECGECCSRTQPKDEILETSIIESK